MNMTLYAGEKYIKGIAKQIEIFNSQHTGKPLEKLSFQFIAKGKNQQDLFREIFDLAKEINFSLRDDSGEVIKEYTVGNHQESFTVTNNPNNTVYTETFELIEKEVINVTSLVIDDVEFIPYKYTEEFDNDALIITAKLQLDQEQEKRLLELVKRDRKYFKVIRKGLNDEPLSMRFGWFDRFRWSLLEGYIKQQLVLVEEKYDSAPQKSSGFMEPEFTNILEQLAFSRSLINELADILIVKQLLSQEEFSQLKDRAKEGSKKQFRNLAKVHDDLDNLDK
jgi:hypothetical protein